VRELHARGAPLRVHEADDALQHLDVRIRVDAEVLRADAPLRGHGGRLGDHERRAADRPRAEMDQVPVVGEPVVLVVLTTSARRRCDGEA